MNIFSSTRQSNFVTKIRNLLPHHIVNTFKHLPNAWLAAVYYGFPAKKMTVIGVTGSDGKTTTVTGIYHILKTARKRASMISTVKAVIGKAEAETGFHVTTPDPWLMQKLLKKMSDQHMKCVVLETTSHGLTQNRLFGIDFDIAVITNISHEHLDYHHTYKNYLHAKAKLLRNAKVAVLNRDDRSFVPLMNYLHRHNQKAKIVVFGHETESLFKRKQVGVNAKGELIKGVISQELSANKIKVASDRTFFQCQLWTKNGQTKTKTFKIQTPLIGNYNISNTLAMIGASLELNIPVKIIQTALKSFPQVPGRMDIIEFTHPLKKGRLGGVTSKNLPKIKIVIDFAHTPNALEQALKSLKNLNSNPVKLPPTPSSSEEGETKNSSSEEINSPSYFKRGKGGVKSGHTSRLIAVFGCAGLRDRAKRPMMGAVAAQYADIAILTAEDPRTEHVNDIIDQIAQGCLQAGAKETKSDKLPVTSDHLFTRIPDRQQAISLALKLAKPGDIVGIFGKGHEKSMCFGTTEYPWSDHEAVEKAMCE